MKPWVIVAIVLTVLGAALFLVGLYAEDFNFARLSTANITTNSYNITDEFQSISIDTDVSNISFSLSNDGSCEVFCQETDKNPHTVKVKDGMLTIRQGDNRKWYDHIGFNFAKMKLVITLPKAEYERLTISSDTGKIDIGSQFSFGSVDIKNHTGLVNVACAVEDALYVSATTGNIAVTGVTLRTLNAQCNTGKITLTNVVTTGELSAETTTGGILLEDCSAGSMELECSTGKITLNNTVISGQLQAETSTGDITLNGCDAESLELESDTGDITGKLLTDKVVFAESDTGKVSIPHCTAGGRCQITTDTGDINIQIIGG